MKDKITETERYKTLLVIITGFLVLGIFSKKPYLPMIGAGIGVISLVFPLAGHYIVFGWNKIGQGLGWVNSKVLLTAIFYIFLVPMALLQKLSGKDNLRLKKSSPSLFVERNHLYSARDLKNTW